MSAPDFFLCDNAAPKSRNNPPRSEREPMAARLCPASALGLQRPSWSRPKEYPLLVGRRGRHDWGLAASRLGRVRAARCQALGGTLEPRRLPFGKRMDRTVGW